VHPQSPDERSITTALRTLATQGFRLTLDLRGSNHEARRWTVDARTGAEVLVRADLYPDGYYLAVEEDIPGQSPHPRFIRHGSWGDSTPGDIAQQAIRLAAALEEPPSRRP
jgi:hypothetical protein